MTKEISEQDKQDFSEYVKNDNLDQARMMIDRFADGIEITKTVKYENARAFFLEAFKQGNLEICVAMVQQYPDVFKRPEVSESEYKIDDDFELVEMDKEDFELAAKEQKEKEDFVMVEGSVGRLHGLYISHPKNGLNME